MAINSDQVNYLVLRYLYESGMFGIDPHEPQPLIRILGFEHTAFTLKNEVALQILVACRHSTKYR